MNMGCRRWRQYRSTFIGGTYLFSDSAPLSHDARHGIFNEEEDGGAGVKVGGVRTSVTQY